MYRCSSKVVRRRRKRRWKTERSASTPRCSNRTRPSVCIPHYQVPYYGEKESHRKCQEIFKNKDVDILEGLRVLGSAIVSASACHDFKRKVVLEHTNHFPTRTACLNIPSECISSEYQRYANQIVSFNLNNDRPGRVPARARESNQRKINPKTDRKKTQ